jgi:peptidyl-tRNA hydrolase
MTYAVRPGVMKTAGKAIAQAGHAALACAREHGPRHDATFAAWRAAGCPGDVRLTPPERWEGIKAAVACTVVQDAGLTQVDPGTETVLALVPTDGAPDAVAGFDRVP